jgi:hypothetical protein
MLPSAFYTSIRIYVRATRFEQPTETVLGEGAVLCGSCKPTQIIAHPTTHMKITIIPTTSISITSSITPSLRFEPARFSSIPIPDKRNGHATAVEAKV